MLTENDVSDFYMIFNKVSGALEPFVGKFHVDDKGIHLDGNIILGVNAYRFHKDLMQQYYVLFKCNHITSLNY